VAFRNGRVVDISNRYGITGNYDFANIAVWNPEIFERIPPNRRISFIPIIADWIGAGGKIGGVVLNDGKWFNIGSRTQYLEIHHLIADGWRLRHVETPEWPIRMATSATVAASAQFSGFCSIGADCSVGDDAIIEDTILCPGAEVTSKSHLQGGIVRANRTDSGAHR